MSLITTRKSSSGGGGSLGNFSEFRREMDRLMSDFFNERGMTGGFGFDGGLYPAVDVKEKDDKYLLDADIPGLSENDIEIDFHDNVLTIRGEKKIEHSSKDSDYVCVERLRGAFKRDIAFDDVIDQDSIRAQLKEGVLHVELSKREKGKESRRKIDIK